MSYLSVRRKRVYAKWRIKKAKSFFREYHKTSQIVLEGNYLTAAGFRPDAKIEVQITPSEIYIKRID